MCPLLRAPCLRAHGGRVCNEPVKVEDEAKGLVGLERVPQPQQARVAQLVVERVNRLLQGIHHILAGVGALGE